MPSTTYSKDTVAVRIFTWAIAGCGFLACGYASIRLPYHQLNWRLVFVALAAVGLGSTIVVDIKILKSNISVSDAFIFLTALLFGGEAATLLAALEAFNTSLRFTKRPNFRFFNAGAMACAVLLATSLTAYWFGPLTSLVTQPFSVTIWLALTTLATIHYLVNTGLMAIANALRTKRPVLLVWQEYYLWMGVTYLASGSVALITALAINRWGFNAVLVGLPILGVLYFSYRTHHDKLEATMAQVEQGKLHLREMVESEERFRGAFGNAPIGMALVSPEGRWLQVNRSLCRLLGYREEAFLSTTYQALTHPADLVNFLREVGLVLQRKVAMQQTELRFCHCNGQEVWTSTSLSLINAQEDQPQRLIFQIQDITERRQAEQKLKRAAFYDSLTGLANRILFAERLEGALVRAKSGKNYCFAVIFMDLHRFKIINESIGHTAGDQLLAMVAKRLQACLPVNHTLARLGGDEFTVLLDNIKDEAEALSLVEQLQDQLIARFQLPGHEIFVTASTGVALYQEHYETPEELLRDADTALQQAKAKGKVRFAVFDQAMRERALTQLQLETDLRYAVDRNEFFLLYQPIMELATNRLAGFEALVRWQHPKRGLVNPMDFISLAEETGHIINIGKFVLQEACQQLIRWQTQLAMTLPLYMSVNVSAKQVMHGHLVEQVMDTMEETGVTPQNLKLEMTESVVMDNIDTAVLALKQLHALGVQLSMDDFGTGYSSLSYLSRLPITTLKVDRSFVSPIIEKPESAAIANTIIILAHNLRLDVVAEGIETAEQLAKLKEFGCGYGQGYYFARPLKSEDAGRMVADAFSVPVAPPRVNTTISFPLRTEHFPARNNNNHEKRPQLLEAV